MAACGKKGPPLAPLVPIPAAVDKIEASRFGSDVYVSLMIPTANIDEHTPADIARVEIYGYTGRAAPPRARWVEVATLIAAVPVAPPPSPQGSSAEGPPPQQKEKPASTRSEETPSDAPLQGARVTVRDTLTPDELVQGKEPVIRDPRAAVRDPQAAVRDPQSAAGDPGAGGADAQATAPASRQPELPLKRFYVAVPFNAKGRPGPPGGMAEFPLLPTPDPPPALVARYTDRAIMLAWEPSGGLLGFLLDRALPEELVPFEDDAGEADAPGESGPLLYKVYREVLPDAMTPPAPREAAWREEPLPPITPLPIPALELTDNIEFERRRCYTVRAVRGVAPAAPVGDASPPACLTPVDVFPPAPPRSVATVAAEGAISLIWEPNIEVDLGGYVVLRGEAPGDTLQPLTAAPIVEARYRDDAVKPGVRYVYAVVAVDNRLPLPNLSAQSMLVEETAR